MGLDFPSKIINSPEFAPVLSRVFSYHADVYDLEAYDRLRPGFGKRIWDLVDATRGMLEAEKRFNEPSFFRRLFGN